MKNKEELFFYLDNKLLTENKDAKVSIPNDIFSNLMKTESMKNANQLAFCFSYLVLNAFLSKYCAYWDYGGEEFITKKDMKVILGYNRENKTVNHLIKVNGVLEKNNLLTHEKDIPVYHGIESNSRVTRDGKPKEIKDWVLSPISDMPKQMQDEFRAHKSKGNPRFEAPIPNFILGVNDVQNTLNDRNLTFTVKYKTFRDLLFKEEMGLVDFCVFYFMRKIAYKRNEKEISYSQVVAELEMSRSTFRESIIRLEDKKLIEVIDTGFSSGYVYINGVSKPVFSRNIRRYKVLRD